MKISLIHPSRGRPLKSKDTVHRWIDRAGAPIEVVISVDSSDEWGRYQDAYNISFCGGVCKRNKIDYYGLINDNKSVVEATNVAAQHSTGDVLIYLSDDFDCPENWADDVIREFDGASGPRLIKVDDMLQPFHVPVLTIPIMNRSLYKRLGYFWYPEYKSMFVDEDLYWTAKKLDALKMCPHLKFEHQHVSVGKSQNDETYRNSAKNWDQGKSVFKRRKLAGFPV